MKRWLVLDCKKKWKWVKGYKRCYKVSRNGVVNLSKYNVVDQIYVHRLVAIAFCPNKSKRNNIVNHKNGNRLDNHYTNLEWTNTRGNTDHAVLNDLVVYGEKIPQSKLTNKIVKEIFYAIGDQTVIGEFYNVSREVVNRIKNRKTWQRLTRTL